MKSACLMAILVSTITLPALADDDDEHVITKICQYTQANDRSGLRRTLEEDGVDLRRIYDGIKCGANGSLLRTAAVNGAVDAATLIATKAGKPSFTKAEGDGMNAIQWIQKKHDGGDAALKAKIKPVLDMLMSK
ncbi:DUF3718 domain-containing protein [Burkholderiaceae bacterium DAT-1]|nr:DUF3718 domain-containing protein [Burkholderiaceae bacterium DAT-1]